MTDIFKGIDNPNSVDFRKALLEIVIRENVDSFKQEMKDIEIHVDTQFIVFGAMTSDYFDKYFSKSFNNRVINYRHYSARGTDDSWVKGFLEKVIITSAQNS